MYSFAMMLWEIASGKVPFGGISPMRAGIMVSILLHHITSHPQYCFYVFACAFMTRCWCVCVCVCVCVYASIGLQLLSQILTGGTKCACVVISIP